MARSLLRPTGFDDLGLRRALSDRMLPFLVAAMAFLAALAVAGWTGAATLSQHWREGAGSALTIQVPDPSAAAVRRDDSRLEAVQAALRDTRGIATARAVPRDELQELLRPWLGVGPDRLAVPLPAVIAVRLIDRADVPALTRKLEAIAPGTLVEDHGIWLRRLSGLAWSLQACSGLALLLVATVASAVIAVATRTGLAVRREAIEIVHSLGATDNYIARRFAARATLLACVGGVIGAVAALPILLALAQFAAPFIGPPREIETAADVINTLPIGLWVSLPSLPIAAATIGFITAQGTVRRWLRRLP